MEKEMKYGEPLIMEIVEARTVVLNWVKPGSTVLEFGCAYGQMTQYMKETLGCKVYIVEYNKESFTNALQYAEDGICGDLLENQWLDKFKQVRFDHILFTDVLEHLSRPLDALIASKQLLADNGEILLSIPNVAHNDITYKLLQEQFEYTKTGLLDETHIHLFTYTSLLKMIEDAGCYIKEWGNIFRETGYTEQYSGKLELDSDWYNILHERETGEVFQFTVKVGVQTDLQEKSVPCIFPDRKIEGKLYYDEGDGITEQSNYDLFSKLIEKNTYQCDAEITIAQEKIHQFRYDMLEGQSCFLMELKVLLTDATGCEKVIYNLEEPAFIQGPDPFIFITEKAYKGDVIHISSCFIADGRLMRQKVSQLYLKDKEQYRKEIEEYKDEIDQYKNEIEQCKEVNIDQGVKISILESERMQYVEALIELEQSKDENQKLHDRMKELEEKTHEAENAYAELKESVDQLMRSRKWQLVMLLKRIEDKIKRN